MVGQRGVGSLGLGVALLNRGFRVAGHFDDYLVVGIRHDGGGIRKIVGADQTPAADRAMRLLVPVEQHVPLHAHARRGAEIEPQNREVLVDGAEGVKLRDAASVLGAVERELAKVADAAVGRRGGAQAEDLEGVSAGLQRDVDDRVHEVHLVDGHVAALSAEGSEAASVEQLVEFVESHGALRELLAKSGAREETLHVLAAG